MSVPPKLMSTHLWIMPHSPSRYFVRHYNSSAWLAWYFPHPFPRSGPHLKIPSTTTAKITKPYLPTYLPTQ